MSEVTVCLPVFQGRAFLEKTLAAIRSQAHADLRVLISVDRSEDDSLAICRRIEASDPRITVIAQDRRLGFVENLNFLIRRVDTEFFCVTPQDDLLAVDYLASLIAALRERPGAALAYPDLARSDLDRFEFQRSLLGDPAERILGYLARQQNYVEWRGVVRSACVDESFCFVAGENVDEAFPLKLAVRGELVRVPRPLYYKTIHARSATGHQRVDPTGRLQLLADTLTSAFSCHGLAAAALTDPTLREMARIALLLRGLNFVAKHLSRKRAAPASEAERRSFADILRNRHRDALVAHRSLEGLVDAEPRHPRPLAILRSVAFFHLALAAEELAGPADAAALMRRALELDPELADTDWFHRSCCRRVLGTAPGPGRIEPRTPAT